MKIDVKGCYSPNYELKPVSMYKLDLNGKNVYLELGYGNSKKVDLESLEGSYIIISHNHIDHAYGLVGLLKRLKKNNIKLKSKIKVYMPKFSENSILYKSLAKDVEYLDITYISESLKFTIGEYAISFVSTLHIGETYGVKFTNTITGKTFVYTSDLAEVTENLVEFSKNADVLLIESGHPVYFQPFTLGKYHGYTRHLLRDIICANPHKIFLTHFKTYASDKRFEKWYPKTEIPIELIRLNKEYNLDI